MTFDPGQFFTHVALDRDAFDLASPDSLFDAVRSSSLTDLSLPGKPPGLRWFFRGQRDASWGITSNLYRHLKPSVVETGERYEPDLLAREEVVLRQMRAQGLGRVMSDGELLMVLQHHGIPTRLIDVSERALEALFFAVEKEDTTDGRLFLLGLRPESSESVLLTGEWREPRFWAGYGRGRTQAVAAWTNRIYVVEDGSLDPRMRAQRGKFLVGGLPKAYSGSAAYTLESGDALTKAQVQRVSNLSITFPKRFARKHATARAAVGWNIEVPGDWKPRLRHLLEKEEVSPDHMYPPFAESKRLGEHFAKHGD